MLNGNEWHQQHSEFLSETQMLLGRADECLNHLELINDDRDAIECLLGTLHRIAGEAGIAGVETITGFARQLRYLLYFANASGRLPPKALGSLKGCMALLAWQVELIDPRTGLLPLDNSEQQELLEQFGCCSGVGQLDGSNPQPTEWSAPLPMISVESLSPEQTDPRPLI
jgi:chemotaxis protein histidine kinase CheA